MSRTNIPREPKRVAGESGNIYGFTPLLPLTQRIERIRMNVPPVRYPLSMRSIRAIRNKKRTTTIPCRERRRE